MKLTRFTDYALRVLIFLAATPQRSASVAQIASAYGISENHLKKVAQDLARAGYLETARGRGGGLRLAMPPETINVGTVVRQTEEGFDLVACGECIIAPACGLPSVLDEALDAFMTVLDGYNVADLAARRRRLGELLGAKTA